MPLANDAHRASSRDGQVRNNPELPPAVVFGADTPIGLTIIRELGERGVAVHAVARDREGIGQYSKWAAARYLRSGSEQKDIELLNRIAEDSDARLVLTVSESDARLLRVASDEGRLPKSKVLVPPLDKLELVNDKLATYAAARELGIRCPSTWQPDDGPEPGQPPDDISFPCILKWRDPLAVIARLRQQGLTTIKAEYCYDADELAEMLERYRAIGSYPMVQSFCPGVGLGHMLFMHEGQAHTRFQHIRHGEWPPEGGGSTVCESVAPSDHRELLLGSEALLKRIGWEGPAMVEYRFDPANCSAVLMEINGRFWGSQPLAYQAGAHFGWLTYAILGLGQTPEPSSYRAGIRCRFMVPETRRVLTLLFSPGRIQNRNFETKRFANLRDYLFAFFNPRTRYYVFTLRDPWPFFADMFFVALKAVKRITGR